MNDALQRLLAGNERYVTGKCQHHGIDAERRVETSGGQKPFAVVLGCADSRVPPELVFDQGLGDLFTIRVAGNVVTPAVAGSIEYAVAHLDVKTIVVLGHTNCGAVGATLSHLREPGGLSPDLSSLVDCISPFVEPHLGAADEITAAVRSNASGWRGRLETSFQDHGVEVIAMEYDLHSGVVSQIS